MQYDPADDAGLIASSSAVNGDAGPLADAPPESHPDIDDESDAQDAACDVEADAGPMADVPPDLPPGASLWFKDAAVFGDIAACEDLLNREIVIGASKKGKKTPLGEWKNANYSLGLLIEELSEHEAGAKDGVCILQGELAGGDRKADAVKACYIMMLDCDSGDDPDIVRAKIQSLGYFAMLWSTYSNGASETAIPREALLRDIKKREGGQREPTLEDAKTWLREEKGYQPRVLADAVAIDVKRHTPETICFVVGHAPMHKFRILLPLARPFDFSEGVSQRERKEEWKRKIEEVSRLLGVHFDKSCVDPSRLMYTPRHPKDADLYWIDIVAGAAIDLDSLPKTTSVWEDIAARDSAVIPKENVQRSEYKTPWLRPWLAKNSDVFLVASFFEKYGEYRGPRNGPGAHYKCPFDDHHTKAGDSDDKGFFCFDARDGDFVEGFVAKCMHDSCSEKKRGHFIDEMIVEHGLSEDDLNQFCDEGLRQQEEPTPQNAAIAESDKANVEREIVDEGDLTIPGVYDERQPENAHVLRVLKAISEEWAFVTMGSSIRYMMEPASNDEAPTFFTKGEFQDILAPMKVNVPVGDGYKPVPVARLWLDWPKRREYMKGVVFDPGAKPDPKKYNLYRGIPTAAKKGSWKRLRRHMFVNICKGDKRQFRFLLLWLAQLFQCPGVKIGSSVVMIGKKGTGKSKLWFWILEALKHHGIEVSDSEHIFSKFNAHTRGVLLMVCEEAFWAGDRKAGGKLKALITQENHLLELKGVDAVKTKNFMRLVFVSNESWVVPAGMPEDERRYFILEVSDARQDDHDYFEAIDLEMEAGGLEAMVYDLMHLDPMRLAPGRGWKALRKPPATKAHVAQAEAGMGLEEQFFFDALNTGVIETHDQNTSLLNLTFPRREDGEGPFYLSVAHLRGLFDEYADRVRIRRPTPHAFKKYVREWFLVEGDSTSAKPFRGSGKLACYKVQPLEDIRDHHQARGLDFDPLPEEE